ncbi:hypothetical protein C9374_000788 [Naegleria lovaniensis]|uniref:Uncharacterized protein n=1 Tax=Naegleria lovaniensis TaxID=51637 RepID=A0AA88KMU2_NAELO|nr:uncharacterized protein C9374_000788 [Naegleria lovaniensis]KAG2387938.1 hypothetical protein C9374_000788 [Naegleria lovaniensis]
MVQNQPSPITYYNHPSLEEDASTVFLATNFSATNFQVASTSQFTRYVIPKLRYNQVLAGDRFFFFVTPDHALAEVCAHASVPSLAKSKGPTNILGYASDLSEESQPKPLSELNATIFEYDLSKKIGAISEFYMNIDRIYAVNSKRTEIAIFEYQNLNSTEIKVKQFFTDSEKDFIKTFITGPLSTHYVVLSQKGKIFVNGEELKDPIEDTIVCGACCGSGVILASRSTLYCRGADTFNVFGGHSFDTFDKIPFKFEASIVDVKCGFYHTLVLLSNGTVYSCGYNVLNQTTFNTTDTGSVLSKIAFDFGFAVEIGCSSRGSWVRNNNDDVFMVGEVVEAFTPSLCIHTNPKIYKFNYKSQFKNFRHPPNDIASAGWQYTIYHKDNRNDPFKSIFRFRALLLKTVSHPEGFSDCAIVTMRSSSSVDE